MSMDAGMKPAGARIAPGLRSGGRQDRRGTTSLSRPPAGAGNAARGTGGAR
jgi:hypothetical protein